MARIEEKPQNQIGEPDTQKECQNYRSSELTNSDIDRHNALMEQSEDLYD